MTSFFDPVKWREAARHEDWYLRIYDEYQSLLKLADQRPDKREDIKEELRYFFEQLLEQSALRLGGPSPRLDAERQEIDMIVVHHTSNPDGISLSRLNVIHLLNLYAMYYASPSLPNEFSLRGQAISSNHYRGGQMVFFAYHWLVRMDGTAERLLEDDAIGWQAGNWLVNCRSAAICFDNDYEWTEPDPAVLRAAAVLIKTNYPNVEPEGIVGHCEVNRQTVCPGKKFLSSWKARLLYELSLV